MRAKLGRCIVAPGHAGVTPRVKVPPEGELRQDGLRGNAEDAEEARRGKIKVRALPEPILILGEDGLGGDAKPIIMLLLASGIFFRNS